MLAADPVPIVPEVHNDHPLAIITYVPEEFVWCDWIYRQLDGIAVPSVIARKPTKHGFPCPSHVSIFPDPRNPADVARYPEMLSVALYLVIVCSPHSAQSKWVDQQIRAFKRGGGEERIVALVVESELDEAHNRSVGMGDADWLPAWIRWRLDEENNFFDAGPTEPFIIDARPGKLTLDQARIELLAAVLDHPRDDIADHIGDLRASHQIFTPQAVAATAAVEQAVVAHAPVAAAPAPIAVAVPVAQPVAAPAGKSSGGLAIAAGVLLCALGGGGYLWWQNQSKSAAGNTAAVAPATTTTIAAGNSSEVKSEPASAPADTQPEKPTPAPTPTEVVSTAPPPIEMPSDDASRPSAITTLRPQVELPKLAKVPNPTLDRFRQIRELGDTLIERQNRDAGMIALSQAAEEGVRYAEGRTADPEVQLEVARLCFRLAALQRQHYSVTEARRTAQSAIRVLQIMTAVGDLDADRTRLIDDVGRFMEGMSDAK